MYLKFEKKKKKADSLKDQKLFNRISTNSSNNEAVYFFLLDLTRYSQWKESTAQKQVHTN